MTTNPRNIALSAPSKAKGLSVILLATAVLVGAVGLTTSARTANNTIIAGQREQRCRADAAVDANQAQAQALITLAQLVSSAVQRNGQVRALGDLLGQYVTEYQTAVKKQELALTLCRKS